MLQRRRWVPGKKRAEQKQGSEPSARRLMLLVALELSTRFWQRRGELVPVHDLNLWLLFLLLSLPLLMAPKGKFLLQERRRKENPQKRRGGGGGATCKGPARWSRCRDVGEGVAVGTDTETNPPTHPGLGCHRSRPAGSCTGGCKSRTCPQIPSHLLTARVQRFPWDAAPGAVHGGGGDQSIPLPGGTGSWRRWKPWERHR